jgi:hypothetical protein
VKQYREGKAMERQLDELREGLERLTREVAGIKSRLERLEGRAGAPAAGRMTAPREPVAEVTPSGLLASLVPARSVALVGRTLVILGGAYLFRAMTETELIPALVGALLGLAYAGWWLAQADRTAGRGDRLSAVFYGISSVLIAYPLVWETTARFEVLTAPGAAAALVAFSGLGLVLAWRRDLPEIAWTITIFTLVTTIGLMAGTHHYLPYAIALLLVASCVELLAFRDRWLPLRWVPALGIHLGFLMMTSYALRPEPPPDGYTALERGAVIVVCLLLPLLYLSSIGVRTLVRERSVTPFAAVQAPLALLVGFSGAIRLVVHGGGNPMPLAVVLLLLGAAYYAAAFASIDRRLGRGRNFYAYTTLAGLLVLVGSSMVFRGDVLAITWATLAVAAAAIGARFNRITLKFHGAVYLTAGTFVAGLITCAFNGFLAEANEAWQPLSPVSLAAALAAVACYGILLAAPNRRALQWYERLPQAVISAVVILSVAGMAAPRIAGALLAASNTMAGSAVLAASRTVVIAVSAVVLAWAGRRWLLDELTWLVYPVLVAGGAKLLWEDFSYGRPMTLFIALAFYGTALIVTPRLIRKEP